MNDDVPHVVAVPRNIGDDMKLMGVPLNELVLLFGIPLVLCVLLRFSQLDVPVPFPAVGSIWLSSALLWIGGPVLAGVFIAYKKGNPDFDLRGELVFLFDAKSYHAGRDVEYRPYLTAPPPPETADESRDPGPRTA